VPVAGLRRSRLRVDSDSEPRAQVRALAPMQAQPGVAVPVDVSGVWATAIQVCVQVVGTPKYQILMAYTYSSTHVTHVTA
jgi:hypothetical protein